MLEDFDLIRKNIKNIFSVEYKYIEDNDEGSGLYLVYANDKQQAKEKILKLHKDDIEKGYRTKVYSPQTVSEYLRGTGYNFKTFNNWTNEEMERLWYELFDTGIPTEDNDVIYQTSGT